MFRGKRETLPHSRMRTAREEVMSNQVDQEIQDILTHIYQPGTDDPHDQSQPHRTLNIYIEVEEQEKEADQPPTIESTLDEQPTATPTPDDTNTPVATEQPLPCNNTIEGYTTKRQHRPHPATLLLLIVPLFGILAGIAYAVLLPLWTPSASVTIVTASQHFTTTSTLQLVTDGTADPTKNQVPGRALSSVTMSQQKTVPATGTTRQAAQAAHGYITFYNGATYSQTIPAGTVLVGADGVQLVTDADAILPAAVFPTFGQASITAHAAISGAGGNVRTGDVYGACCRLNVSAVSGAFHGGQDARTYQSVTQQDITSVVPTIKNSLDQSIQAALQTQVQASETLITPLAYTSKVTPNRQPGEEATQLQVTVSETCTGMAYTTNALTSLATQRATQDAEKRLGTGLTTTTGVQSRVVQTTPSSHGTLTLHIRSSSVWAYPFSQEQQNSIKAMIAGMSKDKATAILLLRMAEVQSVSITLKNGTTLPTDAQHISLLFLQV